MASDQTPAPRQRQRAANPDVLTPGDVAAAFAVDPKTVNRWEKIPGRLPEGAAFRTPGGHRRFRREVMDQHWPGLFPPPPAGGGAE